jgi:hypothetical protein
VQWSKRLFYEPEKAASVHAADSVIITINRQNIPLHTVVPPAAAAAATVNSVTTVNSAVPKGPVKFRNQIEYISQVARL